MIWTLTVPPSPTKPVAPTHAPLPDLAPIPSPIILSADDPGYAAAQSAYQTALAERDQSIAARDAQAAARDAADAAYRDAHKAWLTEVSAIEDIERQPVKTVHGVVDLGGGQFRADVDLDIAGTVERCDYVYRPGSPDASAAHTQLASLHATGTFVGQIATPPAPTPAELVAYAATKRWQKEIGGCVVDGRHVATDRDSQSKLLAEFVAIGGGVRADPSPWKFADGEFASLTNAQMAAVCMGARAHVAGAFVTERQVLAWVASGTITTTAQVDAAFATNP